MPWRTARNAVRDADIGDETAIVRLVAEMGVGFHLPTGIDEGFVHRYLAQPEATILLAFESEQAVGCSLSTRLDLYHAAPVGEIEDLTVMAGHVGRVSASS